MSSVRIPLSSRKYPGLFAIIDEEDFDRVGHLAWCPHVQPHTTYARRTGRRSPDGRRQSARLHRMVLGITDPKIIVDHINGDGLDNRKANLRICTPTENMANRNQQARERSGYSKFRGVTWHKGCRKWQVQITSGGKSHHVGLFGSEVDAAIAYNMAAIQLFGEFARLNEVPS